MSEALKKYFLQSICWKVEAVSDITAKGQLPRYISKKAIQNQCFFLKKRHFS